MKVLVTSTPGVGHIFPMVPVVQALRDNGNDVLWALAPTACARVSGLGFRCVPCGPERDVVIEAQRAAEPRVIERFLELPPRDRRRALFPMFAGFTAPRMLVDLVAIIDEIEPDLVLHEPMELAAAPVSAARGLPHATVGFGGLIPDSILQEHSTLVAELWEEVGLKASAHAGLYDHLYLHPSPPSLTTSAGKPHVHPIRPLGFDDPDRDEPGPPPSAEIGHSCTQRSVPRWLRWPRCSR
jgi:hypothetical protein